MTKSDLMKTAHAEARQFRAAKGGTYAAALSIGLRRAHNQAQRETFVAAHLAQPKTPNFMWLRGW